MKSATVKIEQLYRNNEFKIVVNDEKVLVSEVATSDLGDYIKKLESSEEYKLPFVKPILEKALEIAKRELIKRKNQQMKVYISGPITSLPLEDARRIFESAEEFIAKLGHTAVNPMKNGLSPESIWEEHMKRDLAMLLECDTICMLPNFRESKGAMLELSIATALQMTVINHSDDEPSGISLAEKHLNDIIEEPSRTQRQVMSDNISEINKVVRELSRETLEGIQILRGITPDKPTSNVITNRPFIHPSLLGERTEPTPYANIQRRADFLDNFKDGWALFNCNALFRTIAMLVMNGASEYDLMLELIFMIDGHTIPGTSHLKPFHKQKPTDNETK